MEKEYFDPEAPLDRIKGESKRASDGLMDYWTMGGGRSLSKMVKMYLTPTETQPKAPPSAKISTLKTWSQRHQWQARIARQKEIDDAIAVERYRDRHMAPAEVIARLSDLARGDMGDFADVRQPSDLADRQGSHVIKRITINTKKHPDGSVTGKTTIELHDSQAALEKLARHLGLFDTAGDSEDKPLIIKVLKGVSMDDL